MNAFTELKQLIADADKEATAFYEKKNQAAGVRLRKAMLEIKEKAQAVRVDVSETKKSNA